MTIYKEEGSGEKSPGSSFILENLSLWYLQKVSNLLTSINKRLRDRIIKIQSKNRINESNKSNK